MKTRRYLHALTTALLSFSTTTLFAASLKVSANSNARIAAEVEGNYSTSHLYINEAQGDAIPMTVFFDPEMLGVETAEVFTNLNRRDRAGIDANGDGIHDGIKPVPGSLITAGSDAHYYKAYTMSGVTGGYQLTLSANKTGMYRLTCRWRLTTDPAGTYRYYTDPFGDLCFRAHAVVVSPSKARDMRLYELNALAIEAEGTLESQRSTFVDLWDGPGSTRTPRWSLDYARGLGVNWLWFQPVHPYAIDGRQLSAADVNARDPSAGFTTRIWNGGAPYEDVNYPYALGSPYAAKNFFEIEPRMSKANTRAAAMQEFQDFVNAADAAGTDSVNVMMDTAFNHTAWDVELGAKGVELFSPTSQPTDEIRNSEARFFSRSGNYGMRAFSAGSAAFASDRNDFGKFIDTFDIYWGRYAALVLTNTAGDNDNTFDESDWFDYSIGSEGGSGDGNGHFDSITQSVWRYFADYLIYWLNQTGCTAGTSLADQSWKGVDGLRADFAQGLPPPAWEYMVNRARSQKWSFIFMAESLDGGPVTYRSSRHFDVLNENIVFAVNGTNVGSNSMTSNLRSIFESRRNTYGQSMVLLNTVSHDEQNGADPWEALLRFAVYSTIDGSPMIFQGQEQGISTTFGFDVMEYNASKYIPHFKTYNSMMPLWLDTDYGNDQLYPVYSAITHARASSPALRSSNRYYLDQVVGAGTHQRIFSIAKFESRNASPATSDVVLSFVNLDRHAPHSGTFNVSQDTDGDTINDYGIKPSRTYNLRNLSAKTPLRQQNLLWGAGRTGTDVLTNGVYVALEKVPTTVGAWDTNPYEAQFLHLLDTTAPTLTPAQPQGPGTNVYAYAIGDSVQFTWPAVSADSEGVIPAYRVIISINGGAPTSITTSSPYHTVNATAGQTVSLSVAAVNPSDPAQVGPTSAASTTITLLDPDEDHDHDGMTNAAEDIAGTNPFDLTSKFAITQTTTASGQVTLTFPTVPGRYYHIQSSTDLDQWDPEDEPESNNRLATSTTLTFTDLNPGPDRKFYHAIVTKSALP